MLDKQNKFTFSLAVLILYVYFKGYRISLGDAWAKKDFGRKHSKNSYHYKRLAIDLNFFKDGIYLTHTAEYKFAGKFWKFLGGTWGGDWQDGNHFSWGEK